MAIINILEDEDGIKLEAYVSVSKFPILKLYDEEEDVELIYCFTEVEEIDFLIDRLQALKSTYNG